MAAEELAKSGLIGKMERVGHLCDSRMRRAKHRLGFKQYILLNPSTGRSARAGRNDIGQILGGKTHLRRIKLQPSFVTTVLVY